MKKDKKYKVLFRENFSDESGVFEDEVWIKKSTDSIIQYILLLIKAFFNNNVRTIILTIVLFLLFEAGAITYWVLKYFSNEILELHKSVWYLAVSIFILIVIPVFLYFIQKNNRRTYL